MTGAGSRWYLDSQKRFRESRSHCLIVITNELGEILIIRNATSIDAEAIARVHVRSWQQSYRDILPQEYLNNLSIERRTAAWIESFATTLQQVVVAEINGQIVGFSGFGPCRDDSAGPTDFEIWALYLDSAFWSKGIGRQLWQASLNAIVDKGATRVTLWVLKDNQRAIRFYRAAGFQPENDSEKQIEIGGVRLSEVRYSRRLADVTR